MFSKLLKKLPHHLQKNHQETKTRSELDPRVIVHYGIPSSSSRIAYDPFQRLLAICTLDGRIKVIGGDYIEGLLIAPKQLPFKHLEFLENQGFLVSISNENDVQVWDLEHRYITSTLQWQCNITAFSVIQGTNYMYIGDEYGSVSILMYDADDKKLLQNSYQILPQSVSDTTGIPLLDHRSIVGVLSQPCSHGNRLLFAYDNGIIVLWDVAEDQLVLLKGDKDLHLKGKPINVSENDKEQKQKIDFSEEEELDKEISALCWASLDGSLLAVGYVDGDIMLWQLSTIAPVEADKTERSSDVVKLQLSSSNKRFPVIVLHWYASTLKSNYDGQLFVYGGDQMGSDEVLTILDLQWSSGKEALKNVARVDLTLHGSFADMILLQNHEPITSARTRSIMILTSPGQLHFYDDSSLSSLISMQQSSVSPVTYSSDLPTTEPYLTIGKLFSLHADAKSLIALSKMAEAVRLKAASPVKDGGLKWTLSGGVPYNLNFPGANGTERLYIAGYQDGSVRIWDATYPALLPLLLLEPEVKGTSISGTAAAVSALDFSSSTLFIAVGSESGLVRLYMLTGAGSKVLILNQDEPCPAFFSLSAAPVCTLRFSNRGEKLAVGFESGQIAMLDVSMISVSFLIDTFSGPNSPIISLAMGTFHSAYDLETSLEQSESEKKIESAEELTFALSRDSRVVILSTSTGKVINSYSLHPEKEVAAIGMHIIEGKMNITEARSRKNSDPLSQNDMLSRDSMVLVCCPNVLLLYPLESLVQGTGKSICEVNLVETCCWTTIFQKEESACGLILLYQTGWIEIRSLPNLEIWEESSLTSLLRWNFKPNMNRTLSSTYKGQIALVNGPEFAILSILAGENDFRIPEALPCLHDKVLAASVDADISSSSSNLKQIKEIMPRNFGGFLKCPKARKDAEKMDPVKTSEVNNSSSGQVFSKFSGDHNAAVAGVGELVEFSLDDIVIDEPLIVSPLPRKNEIEKRDKKTERERLFEGATFETKPRQRTIDEIKSKYGRTDDAAAAATRARDNLAERGEKLERISQRSEELRDGAESFASLAQELAKRMENRKWWQL